MKTIAQVLLAAVVADGLPTQWECSWQLQDVNIGNRIVINNDGEYPQVPSTANNEVTITRATVTSTATATATPEIEMSSTATLSRTATTASLTLIPLSTDSVSMTLSKSVSRSESESMTDDSEPTSTLTEHSTTLISGQQTETVTRSLSRSKTESKTIQTWDQIIDSFPSFEIARWATCDLGNVLLVDSALSVAGCLSRCETTSNCVYSESTLNSCRLLTTCSSWNSIMNNSTAVTVKKTSLGNQIPSFFTLYKFNSTCQTGTRSDQETLSECALECSKSNTCMYFSFTNSVNDINGCLIGNTCSYGPSDVELSTQVFRRTPEPLLISIEQGINTTYADAVYSCLNTSRRLCTASEVCRFLLKNNINNQRWIPVADNNNQWLQVATTCRSLSDKLIGVDDNLGLNTPSPPWTDPHSEAFCCPFDYDEVNLCSVPGAIVSDSESLFDDVAGPEACQVQCQSSSSCIAFEYNVMTGLCKTFDAIQSSSTQVQPDATLIAPPQCSPNVNWTCGIVEADTPTPVVDTPVPVYINPDLVLSHFIVKLRIAFADFNGVDFATRVVASLAAGATLDVSDSLEESPRVTAVTFSIGLTNSTGGQSQLFSLQNEVVTLMKRQLPPFDRSGYEVIVLRTCYVSQPCEGTTAAPQPNRSGGDSKAKELLPIIIAAPVLFVIIVVAFIAFRCSTSTAGKVHGKQRQKSIGGTSRAFPEIGTGAKSTPPIENVDINEQEEPSAMPTEMVPRKARVLTGPPVSSFGEPPVQQHSSESNSDTLSPRISRRNTTESEGGFILPETPTKPSKKSRKATAFSSDVKEKKSKKEKRDKREKKEKKSKKSSKVKAVQIEQED